jgi:hypothetical protein
VGVNQDELIERCRLKGIEVAQPTGGMIVDSELIKMLLKAQLRKAIPIIYKEGYKQGVADSDKAEKLDGIKEEKVNG